MIEGTTGVFRSSREKAAGENFERQRGDLHAKIGQLTVEVDLLRKKVETTRSARARIELVEKDHPKLSMRRQCELLGLAHLPGRAREPRRPPHQTAVG